MQNIVKHHRLKISLYVISVCMTCNLQASENKIKNDSLSQFTPTHKSWNRNNLNFEEAKETIWNKYLEDAKGLLDLKSEYTHRALKFKDKTMRFSLDKIGKEPKDGYPLYIALHGGGQASPEVNDSQWEAMKVYYKGSVTNGIYVATRGITDNWNLHSESESYPLYEKLIESAILFDHVNPNRVYLMGFSAGGDGVYQVVPRMPERFAAGNMSAGHNNGIHFDNLYNTPFLLQVGERDSAYDRNHVAAENNITMDNLHLKYNGGFIHDVFIHYNGSHNSWYDNDNFRKPQPVIAFPTDWLKNGNREKKSVNTNAIDWLNNYTRNPAPEKLVWDLSVGANSRVYQTGAAMPGSDPGKRTLAQPNTLFYWLDVSVADTYPENGKLVVEALKSSNTIKVLEASNIDKFRILLNPNLLDLSIPVNVEVGDQLIGEINVKEKIETMIRTLYERSDKNEIYDAQITLVYDKDTHNWQIANAK